MNRLTVRMKLFIGFGTLLFILVLSGLTGFRAIVKLDGAADEVARKVTEKNLSMLLMESVFKESSGTRGFLVSGQEKVLERDRDGQREFRDTANQLVPLVQSERGRKLYAEIQRAQDELRAVLDEEIRLHQSGKVREAEILARTREEASVNAVDAAKDAFVAEVTEGEQKVSEEQDATVSESKIAVIALGVAAIALGLILSAFIARSIIVATRQMRNFIQEIAGNNLAVADVEISSRDEIGEACAALNAMKANLSRMMRTITTNAQSIAVVDESTHCCQC